MIENIAVLVPRLDALRQATGDTVSLDFKLWLYKHDASRGEWSVWSSARREHFKGVSAESAVRSAEAAILMGEPTTATVPDALVTP